jgi:hypothetical protein
MISAHKYYTIYMNTMKVIQRGFLLQNKVFVTNHVSLLLPKSLHMYSSCPPSTQFIKSHSQFPKHFMWSLMTSKIDWLFLILIWKGAVTESYFTPRRFHHSICTHWPGAKLLVGQGRAAALPWVLVITFRCTCFF